MSDVTKTTQSYSIIIPKSVFRRHITDIWNSMISTSANIRIQKKAFAKLHYAVQRQLLECLRAANKITHTAGRTVVTPNEIRLARQLLFRDISFHPGYVTGITGVADNACRQLAKVSSISLSRKSILMRCGSEMIEMNSYDTIRRLLYDIVVEVMSYVTTHEV